MDTRELEIKDFLTYRLNILYRLLDRQMKKILAMQFGYSIAEWRVLARLARDSGVTVGSIARTTYVAKSQISRAAASLVRKGHVMRVEDSKDGRSPEFAITKGGRARYEAILLVSRERQRKLLSRLSPHQRHVTFAAIAELTNYVRAEAHIETKGAG